MNPILVAIIALAVFVAGILVGETIEKRFNQYINRVTCEGSEWFKTKEEYDIRFPNDPAVAYYENKRCQEKQREIGERP